MGIFEDSVATFLAPVKDMLADDSVSEVLVNGHSEIFIERKGLLERTDLKFHDEQALQAAVRNIAQFVVVASMRKIRRSMRAFPTAAVSTPYFLRVHGRAPRFRSANSARPCRLSPNTCSAGAFRAMLRGSSIFAFTSGRIRSCRVAQAQARRRS